MKTKGISIVERHGEKAVVGVFAVLALGAVAWQFLGTGNRVTIENNQKVEPDRAYESITRKAEQIAGQLADPNPAQGIPESVPDAVALVRQRIDQGLTRADDPLPVAFGLSVGESEVVIPEDARFAAAELPALSSAVAAQYLVTLNPLAVADSPALDEVAPEAQPFDVRAVSVQASFPAAEFRRALEEDPDGSGPLSAMPRTFWLNRTALLDVVLERQRVNADGTMGPVERAPASPRAVSFADQVSPGMSPGEFQTTAREARASLGAVVQPPFPPTIAGDIWAPPAQVSTGEVVAVNADMANLQRQLANREREREDVERRIEAATSEQARSGLQARLTQLEADIDRIELAILEIDDRNQTSASSDDQPAGLPAPQNIESAESITLVAHDLTAQPGETYRYRLSLGVTNPLFPWGANLQEDQRDLAADPILYTEPSAWSEPVRVAPKAQVFFTRAAGGQDASAVGGFRVGDASAEVFGLYYGHWRGSGSRLSPGDALSATITLPEGLPIFQIDTPEDGAPTVVGQDSAPETFSVALDGAMLVDVIERSAGASRPDYLAVVRLPDGRLVLRDPDADQRDQAFARARRSAEAGRTATVQDPTPEGQARRATQQRRESRQNREDRASPPASGPRPSSRPRSPGERID